MKTKLENASEWLNSEWFVLVLVMGLLVGMQQISSAQGRGSCADDAAKFCKDVQPGGGRMARCLNEHEKDLSPPCREQMVRMKERFKETQASCQDDVQKFCGAVTPGQGRIRECLKEHLEELSPDCKAHASDVKRGK